MNVALILLVLPAQRGVVGDIGSGLVASVRGLYELEGAVGVSVH